MANIKQQKKRILVGQRQRLENLRYRSSIKTYFRRLQTAVDGGDADAVSAEHVALVKLIDKAGAKRVLHPNTAARTRSISIRSMPTKTRGATGETVRDRAAARGRVSAGRSGSSKTARPRPRRVGAMIDHLKLFVGDLPASRAFYEQALAPLGYRVLLEPAPGVVGMGADRPDLWLQPVEPGRAPTTCHLCLRAASRELVDAFHRAALAAGGSDNLSLIHI